MQWGLKRNRPREFAEYDGQVEILFDRQVLGFMLEELSKAPSVEEGGKYIGYRLVPGDPRLASLQLDPMAGAIAITDFLPSGPHATRTAVELMPDGPYQEALFRSIEELDHLIEHVGSWHSHHCNGLRTLSSGDVSGYFRTVNKPAYNLDFFVASLVKDIPTRPEESGWIDHFLFVRGERRYYSVTNRVKIVDWPTCFGRLTEHRLPASGSSATQSQDAVRSREFDRSLVWFETQEGRSVLATDKRFFDEAFPGAVIASRRDSQVTLTGRRGTASVAVTYPRESKDGSVSVLVKHHDATILRIESTITLRRIAYKAAQAAVEDL